MGTYIGISDDRLLHVRQVARRAQEIAHDVFGWDDTKCREMFVMGFVHDIGYEYAEEQREHENIGGELLRGTEFSYWKEVYHHGRPGSSYQSDELFVLNLADMQTDSRGNRVTVDERLNDIASRYGKDAIQYTTADELAKELHAFSEERGMPFPE